MILLLPLHGYLAAAQREA